MNAEVLIIQDRNSRLGGRGFFFRPEVGLYTAGCFVIQTFTDQDFVAAHFYDN